MKVKKNRKIEEDYPFIQYCWFREITTRLKGEITYIQGGLQVLKVTDCLLHRCKNYKTEKCLIKKELQGIWIK